MTPRSFSLLIRTHVYLAVTAVTNSVWLWITGQRNPWGVFHHISIKSLIFRIILITDNAVQSNLQCEYCFFSSFILFIYFQPRVSSQHLVFFSKLCITERHSVNCLEQIFLIYNSLSCLGCGKEPLIGWYLLHFNVFHAPSGFMGSNYREKTCTAVWLNNSTQTASPM